VFFDTLLAAPYAAVITSSESLTKKDLVAALRAGDYKNDGIIFKLDSSGKMSLP
jgi:hypothetical protein